MKSLFFTILVLTTILGLLLIVTIDFDICNFDFIASKCDCFRTTGRSTIVTKNIKICSPDMSHAIVKMKSAKISDNGLVYLHHTDNIACVV